MAQDLTKNLLFQNPFSEGRYKEDIDETQFVYTKTYIEQIAPVAELTRGASVTPYVGTSLAGIVIADASGVNKVFPNVVPATGNVVVLRALEFFFNFVPATLPNIDVFLFDGTIQNFADGAAFAPTQLEWDRLITVFSVTSWFVGVNSTTTGTGLLNRFVSISNTIKMITSTDITVILVARNTFTPSALGRIRMRLQTGR